MLLEEYHMDHVENRERKWKKSKVIAYVMRNNG